MTVWILGLIEINIVCWNQLLRLNMLRHRPPSVFFMFSTDCSKVTRSSTCDQMVSMWPVYLFAYSMAVLLYTHWFSMVTVFICSNLGLRLNDFNFYVMCKKYTLSLLSALLILCNRVEKVVKLQVISSCSEQNIFILVDKNVSTYLSRFVKTD